MNDPNDPNFEFDLTLTKEQSEAILTIFDEYVKLVGVTKCAKPLVLFRLLEKAYQTAAQQQAAQLPKVGSVSDEKDE